MSLINILFEYRTGLCSEYVTNVRLTGSWSPEGKYSEDWTTLPMQKAAGGRVCETFTAEISFDESELGKNFFWGVIADSPSGKDLWGIMAESGEEGHSTLQRSFTLQKPEPGKTLAERYWVTPQYSLGANRYDFGDGRDAIIFSVWAPNAQNVEVAVAAPESGGYVWDDGKGMRKTFAMSRDPYGVWSTAPAEPELAGYDQWENAPYMFKVTREDGSTAFRTDLLSRRQAGWGGTNPAKDQWDGKPENLDSTKSCSIIQDPRKILAAADPAGGQTFLDDKTFWAEEFSQLRPIPTDLDDLIIYEMHVAGLGAGKERPGNFADALGMLDYLVELGITAVELLPVGNFGGISGWGYGSSHFYANKYDYGQRDELKRFVKACHQHGIAVIVDVVYNHYYGDSERCQWMYDTTRNSHNAFYYYKGDDADYPDFPEGGYCDNMSTGYLPGMDEETVRKILIGSAVHMAVECHVDGFRMDLTQALHSFNVLHLDGSPVPEANQAGIRFMQEWVRTLRFFKPKLLLLAEDHSDWNKITQPQTLGGVGFDASWWAEWYHQLIGDASGDDSKARLLKNAGYGTQKPLKMGMFAGMIQASAGRVVYHESHDEAGNSETSARTIQVAVNGMLFDNTRAWAEARTRVVAGLTMFSAGTPMFFMGEEVGAVEQYQYDDFLHHREDYPAMREGTGKNLFRYYQDIIRLRKESRALRAASVEIIKVHNRNRIVCYRRWLGNEEYLIVAGLSLTPYTDYGFAHVHLKGKQWKEILNSDSAGYGGSGMLNPEITPGEGVDLKLNIPANSIIVLGRVN